MNRCAAREWCELNADAGIEVEVVCSLEEGHKGWHRDGDYGIQWSEPVVLGATTSSDNVQRGAGAASTGSRPAPAAPSGSSTQSQEGEHGS